MSLPSGVQLAVRSRNTTKVVMLPALRGATGDALGTVTS